MLGDVRGRQCDAEGEVNDENVFEERTLADPDQGLGAVHVEIPLRMRVNSKALEFVRRNLRKNELKCYSMSEWLLPCECGALRPPGLVWRDQPRGKTEVVQPLRFSRGFPGLIPTREMGKRLICSSSRGGHIF